MEPIRINLDLNKAPIQDRVVVVRQGEVDATVIEARIYDNGEAVDLSQYSVYFECRHPSGEFHSDNEKMEVSGNTATYTVAEVVGAVEGKISLAYFALRTEGGLYATTQGFALKVLPNACGDNPGIIKAYSSELTKLMADLQTAIDRANAAADSVDDALTGNMDGLVADYLATQKDVSGGFVAYETYLDGINQAGNPDNVTIGKDEEYKLYVKDGGISSEKVSDEGVAGIKERMGFGAVASINYGTTDLTAGSSSLGGGELYLVYE